MANIIHVLIVYHDRSNQNVELPPPPGFSSTGSALVHADASREADPNLRIKRCWDLALGPFKQVIYCSSSLTLVSTGPNEPVHYVHVWELHLHLPHYDGRHDDVQVYLQNYFYKLIYSISVQTSQNLVLCEASFQGV